jgi:uncharacterized protein (TIGR02598 family)
MLFTPKFPIGENFSIKTKKRCRIAGISLVEVVLALGVVSIAMVPLFALLPGGFNILQDAANDSALTLIKRQVAADTRGLGFSAFVPDKPTLNSSYSVNGEPLDPTNPLLVYEVRLSEVQELPISNSSHTTLVAAVFEVVKNGVVVDLIRVHLPNDGR